MTVVTLVKFHDSADNISLAQGMTIVSWANRNNAIIFISKWMTLRTMINF